jgi:hypothetical protein
VSVVRQMWAGIWLTFEIVLFALYFTGHQVFEQTVIVLLSLILNAVLTAVLLEVWKS